MPTAVVIGFAKLLKSQNKPTAWLRRELFTYDNVAELALAMSGSQKSANALIRWLEARCEDLLEVRWPQVAAAALAVNQHGNLNASELAQVLATAPTGPRKWPADKSQ
jgi:hypothetical protein